MNQMVQLGLNLKEKKIVLYWLVRFDSVGEWDQTAPCIPLVIMFESVLFEVISGIGTVGLSLGLSSYACVATKLILTFLMYVGRLGAFSLFDLLLKKSENIYLEKQ